VDGEFEPLDNSKYSKELVDATNACMQKDPEKRPDIKSV